VSAGVPWLVIVGLAPIAGLGVVLVTRLVRNHVRERRKARYFAELSAQHQKKALSRGSTTDAKANQRTSRVAAAPVRAVTVEELVARIEGEGLPVRLRWDGDGESGDNDWPTGVLPRVDENGILGRLSTSNLAGTAPLDSRRETRVIPAGAFSDRAGRDRQPAASLSKIGRGVTPRPGRCHRRWDRRWREQRGLLASGRRAGSGGDARWLG